MTIDSKNMLEGLLSGESLSAETAKNLMYSLAEGVLEPAASGALLAALRAKGETAEEIRGFADAMRDLALTFDSSDDFPAADSVGTGGDGSGSFNLSTGCALLAAACDIPIIKHGNRSVSSQSGSADVLEALGIIISPDPEIAYQCLTHTNFTFLFAQIFHPAMKKIAPIRSAMGVRTIFNILGPLTNPASPPFGLYGAYSAEMAKLMAESLAGMKHVKRAFVVHGENGWDEATPLGRFILFDVRGGHVHQEQRDPRDFGLPRCKPEELAGGNAIENAKSLESVLNGREYGAHRNSLLLGTGLLMEVTGRTRTLEDGIEAAGKIIDSGEPKKLLKQLRAFSESIR
ncbi:MAG: anthranilate phosphoribosyltransferase [Pseudomonadota bacterium]|nr:anthranilate phosphoribosyltransferase [Pseudomonadota bacterium]